TPPSSGLNKTDARLQPVRLGSKLRLFSVLPLTRRWILVNAGQLACRWILKDLIRPLKVFSFISPVLAVPDEVASYREHNDQNKHNELRPWHQLPLLSTIAAVP